jgi:hypothetical protein
MTVDCVVYVSSVLNPRKHPRKIQCLESFAQGVRAQGGRVVTEWDYRYTPSRLAVILGWATTNTGGQNIALRKQIIAEQQQRGARTMCIDASCWKYLDDSGTYLRYSLDGPFYDRAEYANRNSTAAKWAEISQRLNIQLQPPQLNANGHILICVQRDGGFAMKTLDPQIWLQQKISEIRSVSNRAIRIRPHPGKFFMSNFESYTRMPGITVSDPLASKLADDLQGAHSAVFFNSSASVAAACAGIPVFADDASCVTWAVANHDIAKIETPQVFDRQQWIYDLAAAHWSDHDAQQGLIYQKFLPLIKASP